MSTNRRKHSNIFAAWLLAVIFMIPIVTKSLHVCQTNLSVENGTAKSVEHHPSGHDADNCLVCHFTLAPLHAAAPITLSIAVALMFSPVIIRRRQHVVRAAVDMVSLRAPPAGR